jgi:hypothetical protein
VFLSNALARAQAPSSLIEFSTNINGEFVFNTSKVEFSQGNIHRKPENNITASFGSNFISWRKFEVVGKLRILRRTRVELVFKREPKYFAPSSVIWLPEIDFTSKKYWSVRVVLL